MLKPVCVQRLANVEPQHDLHISGTAPQTLRWRTLGVRRQLSSSLALRLLVFL